MALIDVLKANTDVITSEEIHSRLVTRVMSNTTRVLLDERDTPNPQQPTYSAPDNGGYVYGDFLFVPKAATVAAADWDLVQPCGLCGVAQSGPSLYFERFYLPL